MGSFDLISRESMLTGLTRVDGGQAALPFVRLFYGSPSEYLWEDGAGTVHRIRQGEGGEHGDSDARLVLFGATPSTLSATSDQGVNRVGIRPVVCNVATSFSGDLFAAHPVCG